MSTGAMIPLPVLDGARIVTGSYVGTNEWTLELDFGFPADLVILQNEGADYKYEMVRGATHASISQSNSGSGTVELEWTDTGLIMTATDYYGYFNKAYTQVYAAIGKGNGNMNKTIKWKWGGGALTCRLCTLPKPERGAD